jgi:hypothetical protein
MSPRYGWNEMPEEVREFIKNCPYDWDFFGKPLKCPQQHDNWGFE